MIFDKNQMFARLASMTLLFVACAPPKSESEVRYSVISDATENSMLIDIDRTGEVPICVVPRVPGAVKDTITQEDIDSRIAQVRQHAEDAALRWLGFLKENRFWRQKNPRPLFFDSREECEQRKGIIIETDVGPARSRQLSNGTSDPDCLDFYFKKPDERMCRAYMDIEKRTIYLASDGWHGGLRVIAHELGHVFGLGDVYDEVGYQTGFGNRNANSIMEYSGNFTEDDALGINGVWSLIKFGVACRGATQRRVDVTAGSEESPDAPSIFCATTNTVAPLLDDTGRSSCPKASPDGNRYWLSPLQICIEMGDQFPLKCPTDRPDYDRKKGVCCPKGEVFDPGLMKCDLKSAVEARYRP
jgi:hypothetical protein